MVTGEKEFGCRAAEPQRHFSPGLNHQALPHGFGAGWNRFSLALNLHETETAGSRHFIRFLDSAQIGNIDPVFKSHPQDRLPLLSFYFFAIDSKMNWAHFSAGLGTRLGGDSLITALYWGGQAVTQIPHLTHFV